MLAIEIRLLTGRYAAASPNDTSQAEWPPEPARLFSALTAALYDDPEPADRHRAALEWLAGAGAPTILASAGHERHLGDVYVPVNDPSPLRDMDLHLLRAHEARKLARTAEGAKKAKAERKLERLRQTLEDRSTATTAADGKGVPEQAVEVLERRPRQARRFPVALPAEDVVHMEWEVEPPAHVSGALDELCARVARLGHSSSLVSVRVLDSSSRVGGRDRWAPDPTGERFLRVPYPEQLQILEEAHARHQQTEPRILPADPVRYRRTGAVGDEPAPDHSHFAASAAEWLVYEVVDSPEGERRNRLDLSLAQQVARAMRGTLLSALSDLPSEANEIVTGHDAEGKPSSRPHLAHVPLADVGHPHASGSILGVALIPPRDLEVTERDRLLEAVFLAEQAERRRVRTAGGVAEDVERRLRLTLGRAGVLHLRRLRAPSRRKTLTSARWCGPSSRWATASAIALGRNPGDLHSEDPSAAREATEAAEQAVAAACVHAGLPAPVAVWIHRRSLLQGAPAARRFMPFPSGGNGPRRVCVHAEIEFERPVQGPVLLGAGRFFGLGLCLPLYRRRGESR